MSVKTEAGGKVEDEIKRNIYQNYIERRVAKPKNDGYDHNEDHFTPKTH